MSYVSDITVHLGIVRGNISIAILLSNICAHYAQFSSSQIRMHVLTQKRIGIYPHSWVCLSRWHTRCAHSNAHVLIHKPAERSYACKSSASSPGAESAVCAFIFNSLIPAARRHTRVYKLITHLHVIWTCVCVCVMCNHHNIITPHSQTFINNIAQPLRNSQHFCGVLCACIWCRGRLGELWVATEKVWRGAVMVVFFAAVRTTRAYDPRTSIEIIIRPSRALLAS